MIAGGVTAYGVLVRRRERQASRTGRGGHDLRGGAADWPSEIPPPGWRDILGRLTEDVSRNNLTLAAAGMAFYAFLAIPSALTALVSLYGLLFNPDDVLRQIEGMQGILPGQSIQILSEQLAGVTARSGTRLGLGLMVSLLVALWSVRAGTASLITGLNITYGQSEKRGFLRLQATTFGLTLGAVLFAVIALALVAVLPAVIDLLPLGGLGKTVTAVTRWPLLLVLMMTALAALFRFAPCRDEPRWRWVSWGAVVATVLWIAGSALFSIYVGRFAAYDKTYGSLGAVVVLLMWLYLSSFSVLLGAQLNQEIERRSGRARPEGP